MEINIRDLLYVSDKDTLINIENILRTLREMKNKIDELEARLKAVE